MTYSARNMSTALTIVSFGVILGAAGVYIGEIDDAPGMMLIGMLLMVGCSVYGVRVALRKSQT
mgnify:FL=1